MPTPHTQQQPEPTHALHDEADIGSGEKPPSQLETEEMIRSIPPLPPAPPEEQEH
ncbi:MAG: hypothetical protein ACJ8GW_14135 [Massilia sp.]